MFSSNLTNQQMTRVFTLTQRDIFMLKYLSETDNCGFQIKKVILRVSENMCNIRSSGTLYETLHRLRNLNFLQEYEDNLSTQMYTITQAGRAVLNALDRIHNNLREKSNVSDLSGNSYLTREQVPEIFKLTQRETIILRHMSSINNYGNNNNYALKIKDDIDARTEGMCDINEGNLYYSLPNLRELGFLESYTNLLNRRIIMYNITPAGRAVLNILDRIHNTLIIIGQNDQMSS